MMAFFSSVFTLKAIIFGDKIKWQLSPSEGEQACTHRWLTLNYVEFLFRDEGLLRVYSFKEMFLFILTQDYGNLLYSGSV